MTEAQTHGVEGGGPVLVLGIGNLLLGDEGVGVHVVRGIAARSLPAGVECLDGGTGSFALLEPMQSARHVLLVDATADGRPVGTLRVLQPRFSDEYPRTLTAHDIGLKDLLDALHLLGEVPPVTLFAISIAVPARPGTELSAALEARLPQLVERIAEQLRRGLDREAA